MNHCDVLLECGCARPLAQLKLADVQQLVKSVALHCTILRIKSELDQLMAGVDEAGCLHAIQEYPSLFRPMFVPTDTSAEFRLL